MGITTEINILIRSDKLKGNRRVLLLNASEEVLRTIHWKKAVSLLFAEKVSVPYNFNHTYDISVRGGTFKLPSAVIMNKYVKVPYRQIRLTRQNLYLRDNMKCQYTGKFLHYKDATIDHIIPTSRGGRNVWKNVCLCDRAVNIRKGDRTPDEAGLKLIKKPIIPKHTDMIMNSVSEEMKEIWNRWCV